MAIVDVTAYFLFHFKQRIWMSSFVWPTNWCYLNECIRCAGTKVPIDLSTRTNHFFIQIKLTNWDFEEWTKAHWIFGEFFNFNLFCLRFCCCCCLQRNQTDEFTGQNDHFFRFIICRWIVIFNTFCTFLATNLYLIQKSSIPFLVFLAWDETFAHR